MIGRECPDPDCMGYFKIELGTGLEGEGLPCHCPYCGYSDEHNQFYTKEQINYIKSIAMQRISDAFRKDLKKLEFDFRPSGEFGLGISMKVQPGRPTPVHYYREKQLETEAVCTNCTLRYSVYGVFAFCPDCGQHNSAQILEKNLEVITKMLEMSIDADKEIAEKLVENALEDCISAFDGFGREICRIHADKATNPNLAANLSFQNLDHAKRNLAQLFNIDLDRGVAADKWKAAVRSFQKRHLVAHKMGVVDTDYVRKSGDLRTVAGQKIKISANEVRDLIGIIGKLARFLAVEIQALNQEP